MLKLFFIILVAWTGICLLYVRLFSIAADVWDGLPNSEPTGDLHEALNELIASSELDVTSPSPRTRVDGEVTAGGLPRTPPLVPASDPPALSVITTREGASNDVEHYESFGRLPLNRQRENPPDVSTKAYVGRIDPPQSDREGDD